jgi:hypothetical protein
MLKAKLSKAKSLSQKIIKKAGKSKYAAVLIVVVIAAVGVHHLFGSHAFSPYGSVNGDSGSLTIPAHVNQNCTGADDGKCVQFGGDFSISGNKILEPNGQQYIEYGFVLYCLSEPNYDSSTGCENTSPTDTDKITQAGTFWHANTVRLQVAWQNLVPGVWPDNLSGPITSSEVDQTFLDNLQNEITTANNLHMVVIISQQTERYSGSSDLTQMPDQNTVYFWQYMANHFKDNPMVFFDMFNEPRLQNSAVSEQQMWDVWQNGTSNDSVTLSDGDQPNYVGMQTVLNTIKATGANNIVIAESNKKDQDLSLLTSHLLTGYTNIAYGNEPSLRPGGAVPNKDEAQWASNFGTLSQTYPIMNEAFIATVSDDSCNTDTPTLLVNSTDPSDPTTLLGYLQTNHLGLIYYTMDPGLAIIGDNLDDPTTFTGSTYDCTNAVSGNTEGPGQDILNWFTANSQPVD